LQGHGADPTLLQPSGHCFQFGGGAAEAPHGLLVSGRRYCHVVGFVADINAGRMGVHHLQTEVFRLDFPRHLSSLLAVPLVPTG